jgi:hypothetical protein
MPSCARIPVDVVRGTAIEVPTLSVPIELTKAAASSLTSLSSKPASNLVTSPLPVSFLGGIVVVCLILIS